LIREAAFGPPLAFSVTIEEHRPTNPGRLSMRRLLLVFAFLLVAVPSATGARATVGGYGVVDEGGITIYVTGTEAIDCFGVEFPVEVESMVPPAGWVAGFNPNNPKLVGGQVLPGNAGIAPGGKLRFPIKFKVPFPQGQSGVLRISADCRTDISVAWFGPGYKCKCISFNARIIPKSIAFHGLTTQSLNLEFTVGWELKCAPGIAGCEGQFELSPPQPAAKLGSKLRLVNEKGKLGAATGKFTCKGQCGKTVTGIQKFRLFGKKPLGSKNRANKSVELSMSRTCQGAKSPPLTFTLAFDKLGQVDKKKSDLNANGKPDGKSGKG